MAEILQSALGMQPWDKFAINLCRTSSMKSNINKPFFFLPSKMPSNRMSSESGKPLLFFMAMAISILQISRWFLKIHKCDLRFFKIT